MIETDLFTKYLEAKTKTAKLEDRVLIQTRKTKSGKYRFSVAVDPLEGFNSYEPSCFKLFVLRHILEEFAKQSFCFNECVQASFVWLRFATQEQANQFLTFVCSLDKSQDFQNTESWEKEYKAHGTH